MLTTVDRWVQTILWLDHPSGTFCGYVMRLDQSQATGYRFPERTSWPRRNQAKPSHPFSFSPTIITTEYFTSFFSSAPPLTYLFGYSPMIIHVSPAISIAEYGRPCLTAEENFFPRVSHAGLFFFFFIFF